MLQVCKQKGPMITYVYDLYNFDVDRVVVLRYTEAYYYFGKLWKILEKVVFGAFLLK